MCGIVGGISERNVIPIILAGLSRLEYRGYDSVGVAYVSSNGNLERERCTDRVKQLAEVIKHKKVAGLVGIGHTRWATHGAVTVDNAHPHFSMDTLAIVHNGIIENYAEIRAELISKGFVFVSDTDTEVIIHLIYSFYVKNQNLLSAVMQAAKRLHGAYAIGVITKDNPNEVICAKYGAPLILGVGLGEMFFASDIMALLPVTRQVVYLEDGDIAQLKLDGATIYDKNDALVTRSVQVSSLSETSDSLGNYRHYMQKEIFEQPQAILNTLLYLGNSFDPSVFGDNQGKIFSEITRVQIIACGTSYHAGLTAKYWFEQIAKLSCDVDIASEYRYRQIMPDKNTLIVSISQSGETADTLASVKYAKSLGMTKTLAICNIPESTLVRMSELSVLTQAGVEIGVASTKAFTTQLLVLLYLAFTLAKARGAISDSQLEAAGQQIKSLPQLTQAMLASEASVLAVAKDLEHKGNAIFLGRAALYPLALEGALKIKEIAYIHAEGYPAGELKHGPLALIDKNMPVICLMASSILPDKVKSNLQEVLARNGLVYLITDTDTDIANQCKAVVSLPVHGVSEYLLPILYAIPLQLLAYHTALLKGTDVDKPRNLAKSVTVE